MSHGSLSSVRAYYEWYGEREWSRLERPADGALEFAINRHLTANTCRTFPGARVLDLGGGPSPGQDQPRDRCRRNASYGSSARTSDVRNAHEEDGPSTKGLPRR